ncbi:hydrogenase nickel incorporation protein HypB [Haloechinothrix salitolerans]|uniref:Hydrogenase nickel incorporation protein HypB n=1 Tax=Haloechinothrix salitolerans TaxID=926830 RepID=A0ABW2C132_9PSEU
MRIEGFDDHADGDEHDHDHEHTHDDHHHNGHYHGDGHHVHAAGQGHAHGHASDGAVETITLDQDVLAKNDRLAAQNRQWLADHGIRAVNLMSSPGAGKTTLLERTVRELAVAEPVAVIEGDQETPMDALRLRATGCRTVQVNTGAGCHLDADMLAKALRSLDPEDGSVVFIENVGNLVCPALFDLGEGRRVVLASTTEGEDKPLKYPHMFRAADLVLLTKADLLPYVPFEQGRFTEHLRRVNPDAELLPVSAVSGAGLGEWHDWLRAAVSAATTRRRQGGHGDRRTP